MSFWSRFFDTLFGRRHPTPPPYTPPPPPSMRAVAVIVSEEGSSKRIPSAKVTLPKLFSGLTNLDGYVLFTPVPSSLSSTVLVIEREGYNTFSSIVPLTSQDQNLFITLTPVTPTFIPAPREYKGNMCGIRVPGLPSIPGGSSDPSLILSWFYDRYDAITRMIIRENWKSKGYLDVLLSWPDSKSFGRTPKDFLSTCQELIKDGFRPLVMLSAKGLNSPDVPSILSSISEVLPLLLGVVPRFCIGWELSLWLSPLQVQSLIDSLSPAILPSGARLYVHFAQGYAAYQEDGGTTADFWKKNISKLHGLLHQRDLSWDKEMYQARLTDILQRAAGGYNWPSDSGFGHPFDIIALEITAQPQFNGEMSEEEGDSWGRVALSTPPVNGIKILGSGNGS